MKAQLHVMQNSFNRLARPHMGEHPQLAASTSFLPDRQEQLQSFLAPNGHAMAPAQSSHGSSPHMPITSSTRSSLPPSVASWLEQEQQHQRQQQQLPVGCYPGINQQAEAPIGKLASSHVPQVQHFNQPESAYEQSAQPYNSRGNLGILAFLHCSVTAECCSI